MIPIQARFADARLRAAPGDTPHPNLTAEIFGGTPIIAWLKPTSRS
jgi:hypothetical protein